MELDFCDAQITEGLQYHLRDLGVVFRLGEEVTAVEQHGGAALTHLASGKRTPVAALAEYNKALSGLAAQEGTTLQRHNLNITTQP